MEDPVNSLQWLLKFGGHTIVHLVIVLHATTTKSEISILLNSYCEYACFPMVNAPNFEHFSLSVK